MMLFTCFSSSQYVHSAINNVERYLKSKNRSLYKRAPGPFTVDYCPEIGISAELSPQDATYFQSLIGILRWIFELGRFDIALKVSMMCSMMDLPLKGHLGNLFHMFAYLKTRYNFKIFFDPTVPDLDENLFPQEDWRYTPYSEANETIP